MAHSTRLTIERARDNLDPTFEHWTRDMQPIDSNMNVGPEDAGAKLPYVAPEVVDYGDASELTKGAGAVASPGDAAPPYQS